MRTREGVGVLENKIILIRQFASDDKVQAEWLTGEELRAPEARDLELCSASLNALSKCVLETSRTNAQRVGR